MKHKSQGDSQPSHSMARLTLSLITIVTYQKEKFYLNS
jgi:hypothetical protein